MTKLEQVIKALQLCRYDPDPGQECKFLVSCDICPYWNDGVGCREIDLFNDALELLKERQWVSVKDRLPEDDTKALVLTPKGRMRVARITVPHQRINKRFDPLEAWWWVDGFDRSVNATHWMPLPEPPKEGDGNEID